MKLRNKKTGEVVDVESLGHAASLKEKYGYQVTLSWKTEYENLSQCKDYHSLAELNEEWEDVDCTNDTNIPLIKDEKIRKVVRAWADANGVDRVILGHVNGDELVKKLPMTAFGCHISFEGSLGLERGRNYTITELCGEEE